jgi:hypothetical protein
MYVVIEKVLRVDNPVMGARYAIFPCEIYTLGQRTEANPNP